MGTNYEDIKTGKDDFEKIKNKSKKPNLRQVVSRHKSWKNGLSKQLEKQQRKGFQW